MSKAKVALRDISPVMQKLRDFLLGVSINCFVLVYYVTGKGNILMRYAFEPLVAARTQPPPQIPDGSSHKAPKQAANVRPTPGPVYQWDKHYE
ncbi:hypothetical protein HF086_016876 [Spodoptera exigua]|uniref:Uncharacterized protein n=1 Tax=Spodoptera exigua TaxID=7107 RepID=A0A922MJ19_SPOEX|nr:hypothetical protein HF086_016876 [Spodoptera exigua]